jgi:hypothetical protein
MIGKKTKATPPGQATIHKSLTQADLAQVQKDEEYWNQQAYPRRVQAVKRIAQEKINEIAPEWKQRNYLAIGSEILLSLVEKQTLSQEEAAMRSALQNFWDAVKAIRYHSDTLEEALKDDINTDINSGWPS